MINSRRMRLAEHVALLREKENAYTVSVGKPEGKKPLRRLRRRWEDNIKPVLRETGWGIVDWSNVAQGRDKGRAVMNAVIDLRVP
jgi:hypothetical protein